MLSDQVRRRIEMLNRQPLDTGAQAARPPSQVQRQASEPPAEIARPRRRWFDIAEKMRTESGEHLRIAVPLSRLWGGGSRLLGEAPGRVERANKSSPTGEHPELTAYRAVFPRNTLFLDLETCGLAGSPIFLIGLVRYDRQDWCVELLLARTYAEERAILETLWQTVVGHQVLVTFNGKSFDWPMVHVRSTLHRLAQRDKSGELVHFDLLHHARRLWRQQLPNCRLQTLEWYICGRRRQGDIPGSQIPAVYHQYVRSGETREMESVLHHNAVDLVTLWELALRLAS